MLWYTATAEAARGIPATPQLLGQLQELTRLLQPVRRLFERPARPCCWQMLMRLALLLLQLLLALQALLA